MRLKRFNEMFVDEEGNIWDDEDKTKKSFEYETEIVATIDEGDPEEGTSFEIKFWEENPHTNIDCIYVNGVPHVLTERDFHQFISENDLSRLPEYDIHPYTTGVLSVYGDYTYSQMEKMLKAFGIKVVKRDY